MKPVSNKVDFPATEKEILEFWKKHNTFARSIEQRRGAPEFTFYDGPPFATGLPHYGHLLASTIKDIVPRYQTMRGKYVERRFGWDCHGLPVEYEMEQELKISGKRDIEKMGVDVFNEKCRSIVLRYTKEWQQIVTRMGRWVDFDHDYKTMDTKYMESIWWVFKTLWDKDLIYEGQKILPYCPRCATPLSNFETNQGYEEVRDPAITIRFAIKDQPNTYILAWTTTPWTLPSNLLLAVGPDINYMRVQDGPVQYILARERMSAYYPKPGDWKVVGECKGRELAGLAYEPLFNYFADLESKGAFRIATADFVDLENGTGVVHVAPGFGEDDYQLGRSVGVPAVCPIDDEGRFTAEINDYVGRGVKETDQSIIERLKAEGKLVHRGQIDHSYPHCWRCDTPLIYRAISTWFVRVEQLRDRIVKHNQTINWMPEHLRDGRFGKWLEGARDWAISRNRYWGAPLPVWKSADGKQTICVGSIEELERLSGQKVTDLHKHFVDRIEIKNPNGGGVMRRIPEVLDCWFESGAMPYAQSHYPFENKERFESGFPADFIAEGLDQTRGWFYTLMVLSTALFDQPSFRNVVVNGLILAEDGRKMSKRLKNYPDPVYLLDSCGADAVRLYMINSPVVRAEDLCFSEEGVKHVLRHFLLPWWNAYSFFVTYALIDKWDPVKAKANGTGQGAQADQGGQLLDRWILSSLESLNEEVVAAMDAYDLQRSVKPFVHFLEDLTNWYIRRSRRRFWKSSDDQDKARAYATLYEVMVRLSKIAAPFVPFISEAIYLNLRTPDMPESVHLCDFPMANDAKRDPELERQMEAVMSVVGLGRQIRADHDLKVRQPLPTLHVVCRDEQLLKRVAQLQDVIAEELNVKKVAFSTNELQLVSLKAKPNYRQLGPRWGSAVGEVAAQIAKFDSETLENLLNGGEVSIKTRNGVEGVLKAEDLVVERIPKEHLAVTAEGNLVVALETSLTDELVSEGLARELVNRIQNMRKTADLQVTDRIRVKISGDETLRKAVSSYKDYISSETLAVEIIATTDKLTDATDWDLSGRSCSILVTGPV